MLQFFRDMAPFVRRHPGLFFCGVFCPYFIAANGLLAAFGIRKQPHDVAVILFRVMLTCGLLELGMLFYRRLTPHDQIE
jgi:hypothetical protein